jgi:hypothetical protein
MRRKRTLIVLAIVIAEALLVYFLVAQRFSLSGEDYSFFRRCCCSPRYILAYFSFLVLGVSVAYRSMLEQSPRIARRLWPLAVVALFLGNAVFIAKEAYVMYGRRDLERTAEQVTDPNNKIFLLKTGTYETAAGDLTRNPPALSSADTLYFKWCDEPNLTELQRFPGWSVYVYEYPRRLRLYNVR